MNFLDKIIETKKKELAESNIKSIDKEPSSTLSLKKFLSILKNAFHIFPTFK